MGFEGCLFGRMNDYFADAGATGDVDYLVAVFSFQAAVLPKKRATVPLVEKAASVPFVSREGRSKDCEEECNCGDDFGALRGLLESGAEEGNISSVEDCEEVFFGLGCHCVGCESCRC